MKEIFKRAIVRQGLRELSRTNKYYKWSEICQIINIPVSHGNSLESDIGAIQNLCKLDVKILSGRKYYKVARVYNKIDNSVVSLCDNLDIEPIGQPIIKGAKDNFLCQCKYHEDVKGYTSVEKLKRGYRPFNCCKYQIDKLQASIYLYIKGEYADAEIILGKPIIISVPSINKKIIFINERLKDKDKNNIYICLNKDEGGCFWQDNVLLYKPYTWQFKTRKEIYEKLSEQIYFNYENNNWLEAVNFLREYRFDNLNYVPKEKQIQPKQPKKEKLIKADIAVPEINKRIDNNNLAHITILNKQMEVKGEFDGFNQIVEQIKSGEFLGYICLIN